MGQYYKRAKIGTCENMYYMRLSEAQELAALDEMDDDKIKFSDYLKDGITRWRFPFPDEDGMTRAERYDKPYNKSFEIPCGDVEIEHETVCFHNENKNGGYGVNIFLPCPYSAGFRNMGIRTSVGGVGEPFLSVIMEGIRDGKVKTIFRCARCDAMMRFDDEDVKKIKARALEYFEVYNTRGKNPHYHGNQGLYDYAMKVIERIA